jgi:hypothetical protein
VRALYGSHLTCKDSLLVGWGGGTDQDEVSCSVASITNNGTTGPGQLDLDRYTRIVSCCRQHYLCTLKLSCFCTLMRFIYVALPDSVLCCARCTLQLHPDSKHLLSTDVLSAHGRCHTRATECRLVGPTPGSSSTRGYGIRADYHATVSLVSATIKDLGMPP